MTTPDLLPLSTAEGIEALRRERGKPGLMGRSIAALESRLAPHLAQPSDIPATAKPAAMNTTSISSITACARGGHALPDQR